MNDITESEIEEYKKLKELSDAGKLPATKKITYSKLHRKAVKAGLEGDRSTNEEKMRASSGQTKTYKLNSGRTVVAKHIFVEPEDVESKVQVHRLNKRNQKALESKANLWDILPLVEDVGVQNEGVLVLNKETGTFDAVDCSRRRICAIYAKAGLPGWLIEEDLTASEIKGLMDVNEVSRPISRRELGQEYLSKYRELGSFAALYEYFEVPESKQKTFQRNVKAAAVSEDLVNLFVDPMGIPNPYYEDLAKIESLIVKLSPDNDTAVAEFCRSLNIQPVSYMVEQDEDDIRQIQAETLDLIKQKLDESQDKSTKVPTWGKPKVLYSESKKKHVRLTEHKSGRKYKLECSYLTNDQAETLNLVVGALGDAETLARLKKALKK
ncbi:hypothetical protein ACPV5U_27705 [Vibrio mediterranei]